MAENDHRSSNTCNAESPVLSHPTPDELKAEREKWHLSQAEFGRQVSRFRTGERWGQPLANHPYTRQAIQAYESGAYEIGRPFAYAFRAWQAAITAQLPEGARILSGVIALEEIPPGTLILAGKLLQCQMCERWMFAWPTRRYCCEECRKQARRERRHD